MVAVQLQPTTYLDRDRTLAAMLGEDSRRFELLGGAEVVSPSPTTDHQRVSSNSFRVIDRFNEAHGLGELFPAPTDVRLSAYDVVIPDLCFVRKDRAAIITLKEIVGPPDLVVEIISPSTRRQDQVRKLALYAAFGVLEYWLIDIEARALTILQLVEGQYVPVPMQDGRVASVVLAGLVVTISELFVGVA